MKRDESRTGLERVCPLRLLALPAHEKDALHPGWSFLIEDRSCKVMNATWRLLLLVRAGTYPVCISKAANRCKSPAR
jgi:hypothetical protein